jgi:predicted short-subunit dehydrogenase-like oxidoreductase (DUF2520 family)
MRIGLIGAGKVGFTLGKWFVQGGIPVTGYYSRHRESAQAAAQFTGTTQYDDPEALLRDSDAVFLTVPDGEIPSVFQKLRAFELRGKHICHCSGALTVGDAFPDIGQTGAYGYSIHPLFPISSRHESYRELAGAFFCLEGDEKHLSEWETLLTRLGASVQIIPAEQKARYHAACAIASNLVCALVQESLELLVSCGFSEDRALAALTPLLRSNLTHILESGPVEALTGPVERCDTATVEKHLKCLPSEEERTLYRAASAKLVSMAQQKHPERDYSSMNTLLKADP